MFATELELNPAVTYTWPGSLASEARRTPDQRSPRSPSLASTPRSSVTGHMVCVRWGERVDAADVWKRRLKILRAQIQTLIFDYGPADSTLNRLISLGFFLFFFNLVLLRTGQGQSFRQPMLTDWSSRWIWLHSEGSNGPFRLSSQAPINQMSKI